MKKVVKPALLGLLGVAAIPLVIYILFNAAVLVAYGIFGFPDEVSLEREVIPSLSESTFVIEEMECADKDVSCRLTLVSRSISLDVHNEMDESVIVSVEFVVGDDDGIESTSLIDLETAAAGR